MKINLDIGFFNRHFQIRYFKDIEEVVGLCSNLVDNSNTSRWFEHHFLMIDYDNNLSLPLLKKEVRRLQEKYMLPDAYIFESSYRKYHVIFFGVDRDYFECLKIIHETPACKDYKKYRMIRDAMTLRLTPKHEEELPPRFVEVIQSEYGEYDDVLLENFPLKVKSDRIRNWVLFNTKVGE